MDSRDSINYITAEHIETLRLYAIGNAVPRSLKAKERFREALYLSSTFNASRATQRQNVKTFLLKWDSGEIKQQKEHEIDMSDPAFN